MPYENFLNFTEVDEDGDITITKNKMDVSTMQDEAVSYTYINKGPDHFGDFQHKVDVWKNGDSADDASIVGIWAINNSGQTYEQMDTSNEGLICFYNCTAAGDYRIYILDRTNDNSDFFAAGKFTLWYYLTIERIGAACTIDVYSDSARKVLVDHLSIVCTTAKYSNVQGVFSKGETPPDTSAWTMAIEDLDLQEGGLPMGLGLKPAPKGGIGRPALLTGGASFGG